MSDSSKDVCKSKTNNSRNKALKSYEDEKKFDWQHLFIIFIITKHILTKEEASLKK